MNCNYIVVLTYLSFNLNKLHLQKKFYSKNMCMNSITIEVLLNLWTKTIANIEKSAIFYLLFKFCFDFKNPNLYIKKKR